MNINFFTNCDSYNYNYISCFYNLKDQYIFVSKKVCYSSFNTLTSMKCKRVWQIDDINKSVLRAIVRNPYSRLESLYKNKLITNFDKNDIQSCQKEVIKIFGEELFFNNKISFENFVLSMPRLINTECHFFPQSKFIPRFVNHIHHLENKDEIRNVFSLFNTEPIVCNQTSNIQLDWNKNMKNVIKKLYKEDFTRFNYRCI